jgi:hypothetical protein
MAMAIDKNYWEQFEFPDGAVNKVLCPTCSKGYLVKEGAFIVLETLACKKALESEHYDPMTDYDARFSGMLVCDNGSCNDCVSVLGSIWCDIQYDYDDGENIGQSLYSSYRPKYFSPPLKIFPLRKEYPLNVSSSLTDAFKVFFADTESCVNKIRVAVEVLLNELGVARYTTSKGKRQKIVLHKRIEKFQQLNKLKNLEIGDFLLAIKWIGNYGSHAGTLRRSDILAAFAFFQVALDKLYTKDHLEIKNLAKKINKCKKPLSKTVIKKRKTAF